MNANSLTLTLDFCPKATLFSPLRYLQQLCRFTKREKTPWETVSDETLRITIKEKAKQGDFLGAINLLNRLLTRHPDSANDYNNRGLMYFNQGKVTEALKDYNQAISIDPSLDSAYNNRANYYVAQGNLVAALTDYEIAIDLNPWNIKALINLGMTLRQLGCYDLAIENFEMALILGRKLQGRIYAERGYAYHLRGDWNCAIADYGRALAILTPEMPYYQKVQQWLTSLIP